MTEAVQGSMPKLVRQEPDSNFYLALARQPLSFDQTLAELIDNSISADARSIQVSLTAQGQEVDVVVADDGRGILGDEIAERVFRPGSPPAVPGSMNEHGFGVKNSLSRLTDGRRSFWLLSRAQGHPPESASIVEGVLGPKLQVDSPSPAQLARWTEDIESLSSMDQGTRIGTRTTIALLNSALATRLGRPFQSLRPDHIESLAEHFGVFYRPFLDTTHHITIKWRETLSGRWNSRQVTALRVPYEGQPHRNTFQVSINGATHDAIYTWGRLDRNLAARSGFRIYYQGNLETQGIDVQVRRRVVLAHQLTEFFALQRHNALNWFVGELVLDDREFSTLFNKTGLDRSSPVVDALLGQMRDQPPPHPVAALSFTETTLRRNISQVLATGTPATPPQQNAPVWSRVGVEVDILHELPGSRIIYELKARILEPFDVYQLVMYWDALVADGNAPNVGRLVSPEQIPLNVQHLVHYWNQRLDARGVHYHLEFIPADQLLGASPVTYGSTPQQGAASGTAPTAQSRRDKRGLR